MTPIAVIRAGVVLAAAVFATVACGGGQDTGLSSSASSSPTCAAVAGLPGQVNDKGTAALAATGTVTVDDLYFSPTCLTGASGTVTLTLHNRGHLLHNFSVTEQNIDVDIQPGATVTVKVTVAGKPVHFFCKYHRDAGQQGALLPTA
ncbi:MAG: cupredoxin domain-containing protein [Candidatus Dormibacteraceae bacterium]